MELSPETLALDAIDDVGPGGDFLTHEHTLRHYRQIWYPRLFDRGSHQTWAEAGQRSLVETAREAVHQALASYTTEPLPDATLEVLREVVAAADRRAGLP